MKIAAAQIIAGMHNPKKLTHSIATHDKATIDMVPKKKNERLADAMGTEGWGLHAVQGFSLWKILVWIAVLGVLGLAFVALWLSFVNRTDLQNAFVPITFFMTAILLMLGVPQVLGVA